MIYHTTGYITLPWNLYKHPRWSSNVSKDLVTGGSSRYRWITISNT